MSCGRSPRLQVQKLLVGILQAVAMETWMQPGVGVGVGGSGLENADSHQRCSKAAAISGAAP